MAASCRRSRRARISTISMRWCGARSPRPKSALAEIDGVAAAAGPGLIGGLIVGTMMAKGIAWAAGKPFLAVNHLEAHALSVRLTDRVAFPYLLLLVSGGHCQLLVCAGVGRYTPARHHPRRCRRRSLRQDREADRARLSGRPGDRAGRARAATRRRFALPRPMVGRPGCDFSFSGLKTAVRRIALEREPLDPQRPARSRRRGRSWRSATRCAIAPPTRSPGFAAAIREGRTPRRRRRGRRQHPAARSASPASPRRPGSILSRRRRPCAPTMRR